MKRFDNRLRRGGLTWIFFPQSLFLGVFATVSLVSSSFIFSSTIGAQTPTPVDNTELLSYSRALLRMEPARQQALEEIKKIIGNKEVPQIVCNDPNSLSSLPDKAKDIAVNYCSRSQKIVEENGFTIDRFNKITVEVQSNGNLKRQIYNTLLRLQKNPNGQ